MTLNPQPAAPLPTLELLRDSSPVPFAVKAKLTAGYELVFLPLMPDWHHAPRRPSKNSPSNSRPDPL